MTIWTDALKAGTGPTYQRLADGLHRAIVSGALAVGDRLPPQRDLAYELGVSIGTITRTYELATRRGDISAVTGKGSFVASPTASSEEGSINLRVNLPADVGQGVELAASLGRRTAAEFLSYIPFGGSDADRKAGAVYMALGDISAKPDDVIVTAGGQHALTTALMIATKPGDLILCEPHTFAGFLDFARLTDRRVLPIPADKAGIRTAAFEELCAKHKPAAAFLTPTAQNPTGTTLSLSRRKALAKSATSHNVTIIEDGLYDPLAPNAPAPLHSLIPDLTFYVASLSKTVAPGLRVGYLICPRAQRGAANDMQHLLGMGPPRAMADIATELIVSGGVETMTQAQANEIKARHRLANGALGRVPVPLADHAPHLWLDLPGHWTSETFAAAAETAGVLVSPASHFSVEAPSNHVRLALGAAPSRQALTESMQKLAALMQTRPLRASRSV